MKRLIIVTGSSRGIGKAIVTEFNRIYKTDCSFLLLARDLEKLEQVKNQILEESDFKNDVHIVQIDFSQQYEVSDYFSVLKNSFPESELIKFDELIVVYNHGTLEFGSVSLIAQEPLRKKFETNLFSIWSLLAAVNLYIPISTISRQFHVNISSGYANEAVPNWSGHCCGRTARDMLFKCLALEQPGIRVLNYEPGIVYTDMLKQACEVAEEYTEGYNSGKFIKAEDTAKRLIQILAENQFNSGSKMNFSKKN